MKIGDKLGCYLCDEHNGWRPDAYGNMCVMAKNEDLPQKAIKSVFVGNRADPTEAYVLECGHTII